MELLTVVSTELLTELHMELHMVVPMDLPTESLTVVCTDLPTGSLTGVFLTPLPTPALLTDPTLSLTLPFLMLPFLMLPFLIEDEYHKKKNIGISHRCHNCSRNFSDDCKLVYTNYS